MDKVIWWPIVGIVLIIFSCMGTIIIIDDVRARAINNIEKEFESI